MIAPALGQFVPAFTAPATSGKIFALAATQGKNRVVYFYPKDSSPGCTQEGLDFRDLYPEFAKLGAEVFGVSRDSLKSHENFKAKQGFPFELVSDGDENLCRLFDVIRPKKLYGKEVLGIERSTFLIDREGRLAREWRKVKVQGHALAVLGALREIEGV